VSRLKVPAEGMEAVENFLIEIPLLGRMQIAVDLKSAAHKPFEGKKHLSIPFDG